MLYAFVWLLTSGSGKPMRCERDAQEHRNDEIYLEHSHSLWQEK